MSNSTRVKPFLPLSFLLFLLFFRLCNFLSMTFWWVKYRMCYLKNPKKASRAWYLIFMSCSPSAIIRCLKCFHSVNLMVHVMGRGDSVGGRQKGRMSNTAAQKWGNYWKVLLRWGLWFLKEIVSKKQKEFSDWKKRKKKKSPAFRFYTCQDLQAVVVGAAFMLGMSSVLQGPGHKVERKWSVP